MHRWVEMLTERMEAPIANGWKTSEVEEHTITRRLKAILGFEIQIERLERKFKLGQDEPKKDAIAVADHLDARGRDQNGTLARKFANTTSYGTM